MRTIGALFQAAITLCIQPGIIKIQLFSSTFHIHTVRRERHVGAVPLAELHVWLLAGIAKVGNCQRFDV